MPVRLRDVALQAGVSIGTASQALNQHPSVNEETRQRVVEAARMLGYALRKRPQPEAKKQPFSIIGVVSEQPEEGTMFADSFYSRVYAGIEAECRRSNIGFMVSGIELDQNGNPLQWPTMIRNALVDGLIFVGEQIRHTAVMAQQQVDAPSMLIANDAQDVPFDQIVPNLVQGATMAIDHLWRLGHRYIGFLADQQDKSCSKCCKGYMQTLQQHGVYDKSFVAFTEPNWEQVYRATISLLERYPHITALLCCDDYIAIRVMTILRERGIRVPEDISLVGFDNSERAEEVKPQLTTVDVHADWIGMLAVRSLVERADQVEKPKTMTLVATQLVERQSTASPRN